MSFEDDVRIVREALSQDIQTGRAALGDSPPGTTKVPKENLLAEYQTLRENATAWELKIMERALRLLRRGYKRADQMAELQVAQYAVEMEKLMAKGTEMPQAGQGQLSSGEIRSP